MREKAADLLPARGAGTRSAVALSCLLVEMKDRTMRIYVPRTRKEIEQKLRGWGVTRIRGVPLRDLSKKELTREYCKQYRQICKQKEADAEFRRLPGL